MNFMTLASEASADVQLLDFRDGGKVRGDEADSWLMKWLATSTMMDGAMLIAEDWRARPTSTFLHAKGMPACFYDDEVYYLLRERDPRKFPYWRIVFSNTVPTFHAFVISDDVQVQVGKALTSNSIDYLAANVRAVICGAYDGEGYVIGEKARQFGVPAPGGT